MSKFKVGDKVRVYRGTLDPGVAYVTAIDCGAALDILQIQYLTDENYYYIHPKQCRRLKPKGLLREIWVNEYKSGLGDCVFRSREAAAEDDIQYNGDILIRHIRFREVKEKK